MNDIYSGVYSSAIETLRPAAAGSELVSVPKLHIRVLDAHIGAGETGKPESCPIALALKGEGHTGVHVDVNWLSVDGYVIPLPEAVSKWIDQYDIDGAGEPFEFDLPDAGYPFEY